jgi:hypothetical protein
MLKLNERYAFDMPKGAISNGGIDLILKLLESQNLQSDDWKALNPITTRRFMPSLPHDWTWEWLVTGKGEYVGTFPKRVSKYYWQTYELKFPKKLTQELGNIARQHSSDNSHYEFEFVNRFNWSAGDFGDKGSCYFGSHKSARDTLQENNALAIRFYEDGKGFARAWIAQLENSQFILFNGYGIPSNPTLTIARIFATWIGLGYKKIDLYNHGESSGDLYINNGTGYLIGTAEQLESLDSHDLEYGCENCLSCYSCGGILNEDESYNAPNDETYCQDCFYDTFDYCAHCDETYYRDEMTYIDGEGDVCNSCLERRYTRCEHCEDYHKDDSIIVIEGDFYCDDCAMEIGTSCDNCGEMIKLDHATSTDRGVYCEDCKPKEDIEE